MRKHNHDLRILQMININILEGSFCEQVDSVREAYKHLSGKRLKYRTAVEWVDLLHRNLREQTAARPQTGFELSCPNCYGDECDLIVEMNDLSTVRCLRCMEDFTPEEARDTIAEALAPWNRYLTKIKGLKRGAPPERLDDRLEAEREERKSGCRCVMTGPV
jgi:hypothetical protein